MDVTVALVGGGNRLRVSHPAPGFEEVADDINRRRGLVGTLIQEGENALGDPVSIMVPLHRIQFVAEG